MAKAAENCIEVLKDQWGDRWLIDPHRLLVVALDDLSDGHFGMIVDALHPGATVKTYAIGNLLDYLDNPEEETFEINGVDRDYEPPLAFSHPRGTIPQIEELLKLDRYFYRNFGVEPEIRLPLPHEVLNG